MKKKRLFNAELSAEVLGKRSLQRFVFCRAYEPLFGFLEQGVIFRVRTSERVSVFSSFILKQGQGSRTFEAHPYPNISVVSTPVFREQMFTCTLQKTHLLASQIKNLSDYLNFLYFFISPLSTGTRGREKKPEVTSKTSAMIDNCVSNTVQHKHVIIMDNRHVA